MSTLGIWKVASVAIEALPAASDTEGAEALERVSGERAAAIVRLLYCESKFIQAKHSKRQFVLYALDDNFESSSQCRGWQRL